MSHETVCQNSTRQETRGSMSDCLNLVSKETCQNYNRQEPTCSTSGRLMFVLKKICHVKTHNNIMAASISNTYETDIMQKYNGLHQKCVDITKIRRHKNETG